jgi:predicted MFS family arabinose efflux permease
LGGWLVDHWSWRAAFLINPAVAAVTLWISFRDVPESRDPEAPRDLDLLGGVLSFCGLGGIVFGLIRASELGWRSAVVLGSCSAGALLLAAFLAHEARSRAPMVPLELFRSRDFVGVNVLTWLLYGALGGAFFFLPFLLVQVHGYTATEVGAVFLPFTLLIGALSRWSGGLLTRFGARKALIVGPAIAALGFALLAVPGAEGSYATTFLLPMAVLGFGMAVTVAPLTTAVINAVPARQVGMASAINNAIASVASLLVIAASGAIAVATFDRALDRHLDAATASSEVRDAVDDVRDSLAPPPLRTSISPEARDVVHSIVEKSWVDTTRLIMLAMAALALAGSTSAAISLRPIAAARKRRDTPSRR